MALRFVVFLPLSFANECRPAIHTFSMGCSAGGSRISGAFRGRAVCGLGVPISGVPPDVRVGCVKLLSGDANWRNLHALRFHFMTQPLPNPLAWYVYQSPGWLLDSLTLLTLAIELACPFLLFFPRRLRHIGAALLITLQVAILLTGNYAFFNFLSIATLSLGV